MCILYWTKIIYCYYLNYYYKLLVVVVVLVEVVILVFNLNTFTDSQKTTMLVTSFENMQIIIIS